MVELSVVGAFEVVVVEAASELEEGDVVFGASEVVAGVIALTVVVEVVVCTSALVLSTAVELGTLFQSLHVTLRFPKGLASVKANTARRIVADLKCISALMSVSDSLSWSLKKRKSEPVQ